jgi:hypothetical protein
MSKNDIEKVPPESPTRLAWSDDHRINWVEWRVRELTIRNGQYCDERGRWLLEAKEAGGRKFALGDKVADYAVWLLRVRDGLSWHQVAYRFFPEATEPEIQKYQLRVRRVYDRVEKNHPGSTKYRPPRLTKDDRFLMQAVMLGAVPIYLSPTK